MKFFYMNDTIYKLEQNNLFKFTSKFGKQLVDSDAELHDVINTLPYLDTIVGMAKALNRTDLLDCDIIRKRDLTIYSFAHFDDLAIEVDGTVLINNLKSAYELCLERGLTADDSIELLICCGFDPACVVKASGDLIEVIDQNYDMLIKEHEDSAVVGIIHSDLDGYASGAVILAAYPNATMIEYNYHGGLDMTSFTGKHVIISDVSLPREDMLKLMEITARFEWYDHHISAISKLEDLGIDGIRSTDVCGAVLTYRGLVDRLQYEVDESLLESVNDSDLFLLHIEGSRALSVAAATLNITPTLEKNRELWRKLLSGDIDERNKLIEVGHSIIECSRVAYLNHREVYGKVVEFHGLTAYYTCGMSANPGGLINDHTVDGKEIDVYIIAVNRGEYASFSLYASPTPKGDDFDLSAIAAIYGGGGHKKAAGITLPVDQLPIQMKVEGVVLQKSVVPPRIRVETDTDGVVWVDCPYELHQEQLDDFGDVEVRQFVYDRSYGNIRIK